MTAIESDILDLENIPIIRKFHPDDLEEVMKLNNICFPNPYSVVTFNSLYEQFPKGFLVAEINNKIVGYIMCRITHFFSFRKFKYQKEGHIVSIGVSPDKRSRGIGTMLLERIINYFENYEFVSKIRLEVRLDNRIAQEMYIKKGFIFERVVPSYYRDGTAAYVMSKNK